MKPYRQAAMEEDADGFDRYAARWQRVAPRPRAPQAYRPNENTYHPPQQHESMWLVYLMYALIAAGIAWGIAKGLYALFLLFFHGDGSAFVAPPNGPWS